MNHAELLDWFVGSSVLFFAFFFFESTWIDKNKTTSELPSPQLSPPTPYPLPVTYLPCLPLPPLLKKPTIFFLLVCWLAEVHLGRSLLTSC